MKEGLQRPRFITFRVSRQENELLRDMAWKNRQTLSAFIRQTLRPFINDESEGPSVGKGLMDAKPG
jgi:hypothetical protein